MKFLNNRTVPKILLKNEYTFGFFYIRCVTKYQKIGGGLFGKKIGTKLTVPKRKKLEGGTFAKIYPFPELFVLLNKLKKVSAHSSLS